MVRTPLTPPWVQGPAGGGPLPFVARGVDGVFVVVAAAEGEGYVGKTAFGFEGFDLIEAWFGGLRLVSTMVMATIGGGIKGAGAPETCGRLPGVVIASACGPDHDGDYVLFSVCF
jgi:hypothetical protein